MQHALITYQFKSSILHDYKDFSSCYFPDLLHDLSDNRVWDVGEGGLQLLEQLHALDVVVGAKFCHLLSYEDSTKPITENN